MYNKQPFITAVEFLGQVAPQNVISRQLRDGISNDDVVLKPTEHFVRKDMSGAAGITHLIDNTTEQRQGVSSIDKGKLPTSEAFILDAIAIKLGKGETAGSADYDKKPVSVLRNAELVITQGGREVFNAPVASLANEYTGSKIDDDFHKLGGLVYLGDDRDFVASLKFPTGETMPAKDGDDLHFVEIRMRGYKTAKRI